ncbi:MAG: hypothetical protein WAV84_01290, partial [Bacteroidota bacterium]
SQPGQQASREKSREFEADIDGLLALPTVRTDDSAILEAAPLVEGDQLPDFWCRSDGETAWLFFANPASQNLRYPLAYGQAEQAIACRRDVRVHWKSRNIPVTLDFAAGASILVEIGSDGITHKKTYILSSK